MKKPCITIISNNLAAGSALSSSSLARALQDHFDVHIIGTVFGPSLWPGLRNLEIEIDVFPGVPFPAYFLTMRQMLKRIRGDVVLAHQLRLPSFGTGLLNKLRKRTPCALYIDDDDLALTMPGRSNRWRDRLRAPSGDIPTRLMYRLRDRADMVFCGSDYFTRRFGGITVPLGRDTRQYDPNRADRESIREKLEIQPHQTVIGFIGNPRPHVGIEDLVRALEIIDDPAFVLLVVPPGEADEYARRLFQTSPVNIKVLENRPSEDVPAYLAASDIVVVPQRREAYSMGQLPARIVEAMAMSKPIITTRMADIPDLLGGGAIYVEERSPEDIAGAIRRVHQNSPESATMGKRARAAFLNRLSLEAMAAQLVPPLQQLASRGSGQ